MSKKCSRKRRFLKHLGNVGMAIISVSLMTTSPSLAVNSNSAEAANQVIGSNGGQKAAKEARRVEEQRERELRDSQRTLQQEALAAARADEQLRRSLKRKAEAEAREAAAEAKRARVRQDACDETMRQIHFLRDEMGTVGDRAEELLGKLISLNCSTSSAELVWIRRLVEEAIASQDRLMAMIEAAEIDWQTKQHAKVIDEEIGKLERPRRQVQAAVGPRRIVFE